MAIAIGDFFEIGKALSAQGRLIFRAPALCRQQIAVQTVKEFKAQTQSEIKVIFNVFKDSDYEIYRNLLG